MKLCLLLAVSCLFIIAAGGALQPQATNEPVSRGQQEERAALKHFAQSDVTQADQSHDSAAAQYVGQARTLNEMGHYPNAASMYVKAAIMYATANQQERAVLQDALVVFQEDGSPSLHGPILSLIAEYAGCADMNKIKMQSVMHHEAADCCHRAAMSYSTGGHLVEALMMSKLAIRLYEASAQSALACGDHEAAAHAFSLAARLDAMICEVDHARCMRQAEAQQHEASAVSRLAHGDVLRAGDSYAKAAQAYQAAGDMLKARCMTDATAALLVASNEGMDVKDMLGARPPYRKTVRAEERHGCTGARTLGDRLAEDSEVEGS